jgi:hypothetical protein
MKNIFKSSMLISFLCLPLLSLAAAPQFTITNATGCLEQPNGIVTYVKPVTIYAFVSKDGKLSYSGVSVKPGEKNVAVPMSDTKGTGPTIFLGTDPHDARPHIAGASASTSMNYLIVQQYNSMAQNGCGNPNYPCVSPALIAKQSQCLTDS